jgi:hypothetical protein
MSFGEFFKLTTFGGDRYVVGCSAVATFLGRKRFASCDAFYYASLQARLAVGHFISAYVT